MSLLSREALLAKTQRRFKVVDLPDGSTARIRNLNELEKSEFESAVLQSKGGFSMSRIKEQRLRMIVQCLVDVAGNRLMTDADMVSLREVDGAITAKLYDECRKHCGFDENDLEELVKNSDAIAD